MTSLPLQEDPALAQHPEPRRISRRPTGGDAVFAHTFRAIGTSVLVITGGIGIFLAYQSKPTIQHYGLQFLWTVGWDFDTGKVGVAALLIGTIQVALVAMSIAFPLALGTALYINEYAPPRAQATLIAAVDLMAAVPSIVYGLWGRDLMMPHAGTFAMLVNRHIAPLAPHGARLALLLVLLVLGAVVSVVVRLVLGPRTLPGRMALGVTGVAVLMLLPCFTVVHGDANAANLGPQEQTFQKSAFVAGIAVAMMVLPMACAIMRQVFSLVPAGEKEAALALGSTKWGMIRTVVLPFGKGGIIGGTMLGLGRALGETIAVLLIVNLVFEIKPRIFETGVSTVSATIAAQFGEARNIQLSALLTAGFVLFLLTLVVNSLAAIVVNRSRSGAESS